MYFYSGASLVSKQRELLREVLPKAVVIGVLVNPSAPAAEPQMRDAQAAARALGRQIQVVHARSEGDFDAAFAKLVQERADVLLVAGDALFYGQSVRLAGLAALRHRPISC